MPPQTSDLDPKQPEGASQAPEEERTDGPGGTPADDNAPAGSPASDAPAQSGSSPAAELDRESVDVDLDAGDDPDDEFENRPTGAVEVDESDVVEIDDVEVIDEQDAGETSDAPGAAVPPPSPPPAAKPPPPPPPSRGERRADPDGSAPVRQETPPPEEPPPLAEQIDSPTVLERAIAEYRSDDYWEAQAERLARQLEAARDRRNIAAVAYELGELYERRLADEARAVKAYGRALQSDPSLRANLWAIRRVFYRRGLWPNLLKLIDAEIRFAVDDRERADLLTEKGQILEDRTDDPDGARDAYEKAVALDAGALPALMSLERLAIVDGDEDAQQRIWRALADGSPTPERKVGYLLDIVDLLAARGDFDGAREVVAEAAALEVDVERVARARQRIGELAGDAEEVLAALESRIAQLLERCGPSGPPEATGPRQVGQPLDRATAMRLQIVALRRRQARVARELGGDDDRAWTYLESALTLAPGEPLLLADLADLAEQLGKYEELAELVQGWESLEADPNRSLSLSLRRAEALVRGGQTDQARTLLDSLSAQAPGYLPVVALREREALAGRDWEALAQALTTAADAARLGTTFGPGQDGPRDAGAAAALYTQAGDLYASYVGDDERARERYGQALEAVPGHPSALEALATVHEQGGRFDEATALLELHSEVGDPDYRRALLERLVRLYELTGQREQCLGALERIAALDPDDMVSRWRVHDALVGLGKEQQRGELLERIAADSGDPTRQGMALLSAARVWDRLGDPGRAAERYREVLEVWPGNRYARAALLAGLRAAGRWEDVVRERLREAEQLADGPELVGAYREAAAVTAEKLARPAEAADLYRALLDRVPGDPFALRACAETLRDAGDHEAATQLLEQHVEALTVPEVRAQALVSLGAAQERADRPADAADSYRRAVEESPDGGTLAAVALFDLSARAGDATAQAEAAVTLAESREHAGVRSELLEDAGWTALLSLDDPDRAFENLQLAADTDPSRATPRLGAALLHARRGDIGEVGDGLAQLAEAVDEPRAAAALLLRSAAIAEAGGDDELGRARRDRARQLAPDDVDAVIAAADHVPALSFDPGGAGEDPTSALEARAELLARRAESAGDASSRDDWQLDRAEALEGAGRLREAGALVSEVLRRRPEDIRALATLRRLARLGGDRASLARASLAMARRLGDRQGQLELLREAAAIFDEELGDASGAVAAHRRILALEPGAPEFSRLRAIYVEADDVRGLVELLGERLNWLDEQGDDTAKVPPLLERAMLREHIGDERGAARDLSALLDIHGSHAEALWRHAEILARTGEADRAAEHLRRFLDVEEDPERRGAAELRLSEILAESMGDVSAAVRQLERVIEQSPDDLALRERMVSLCSRAGDWQAVLAALRDIERRRARPAERARDQLRLAAVYRDRLDDRDRARQALERARQLDPLNLDAVRDLAELVALDDLGLRRKVLRHATGDVRAAIAHRPEQAALYERLAVIGRWLGDDDAQAFALQAQDALGSLSTEQREFLAARADTPRPSGTIESSDWKTRVQPTQVPGIAERLWGIVAEGVAKGLDVDAGKLGFGRGDRVGARNLAREFPAVASVLEAFGVGECDLFVSEGRPGRARVLSHDKPVILLGADVARAESGEARFLLGRAAAWARDRTGTLADLRDDEVQIVFAAAVRLAGTRPAPVAVAELFEREASAIEERARGLGKAMSRRDKKALGQIADRLSELPDPASWRRAALAAGARAGLLVAGSLGAALEVMDVGRGGRSLVDDRAALDLLAWSVSGDHLALRHALGLAGGK